MTLRRFFNYKKANSDYTEHNWQILQNVQKKNRTKTDHEA